MSDDQETTDDLAFMILMEVVQLSRSGLPYKHLLPDLKIALKNSPAATDMCNVLIKNLEGK